MFKPLTKYLKNLESGCPEFFNNIENRCSQIKIKLNIKKEGRYNNACKLADLALKSCSSNLERHSAVENFMLINDSSTIKPIINFNIFFYFFLLLLLKKAL
ncbi:hypothetical protein LLG07_00855, partial [bacterium]|nr:hypothetical protein [bacterium]